MYLSGQQLTLNSGPVQGNNDTGPDGVHVADLTVNHVQGDTSGWSRGFVDIKIKVSF